MNHNLCFSPASHHDVLPAQDEDDRADGATLPSPTFLLLHLLVLFSMFIAVVTGQEQQQQQQETTTTTICSPASNTFTAKINFHQGHVGY
jgi:hypothetical protein